MHPDSALRPLALAWPPCNKDSSRWAPGLRGLPLTPATHFHLLATFLAFLATFAKWPHVRVQHEGHHPRNHEPCACDSGRVSGDRPARRGRPCARPLHPLTPLKGTHPCRARAPPPPPHAAGPP